MKDSPDHPENDPYLLETVLRGCDLLKVFRSEGEVLRLKDLVERTGLHKSVVFRLAHTLECGGFLQRTEGRQYRSMVKWVGRSRFKIGYAAQADDSPFSDAVTESLSHAASKEGIDLVVLNNHYSAKAALGNAERLIHERVDLALEFQTFDRVAPIVATRFHEAGIPLIAIEIPHPGATYYGANNYQVGLCAGRMLGRWARQHWDGAVAEVLLLELRIAGPVPQLRLTGFETGLRETPARLAPRLFRPHGHERRFQLRAGYGAQAASPPARAQDAHRGYQRPQRVGRAASL